MSEWAVDPEIESGEWPQEFSGAWMGIINDYISNDTICALYFNNNYPEAHLENYSSIPVDLGLPQAYISWRTNGECREIFVHPDYRRRGIGRKLCAWARYYANYSQGLLFTPPAKMTEQAQLMFQNISLVYGEPYTDPEEFPSTIPYGYWGGYLV